MMRKITSPDIKIEEDIDFIKNYLTTWVKFCIIEINKF